jgi:hypothetical protein
MATCDQLQTKLQDLVRRANGLNQEYTNIRGSAPSATLEQLQSFLQRTTNLETSLSDVSADLLALNKEASDNGCRDVAEKSSRSLNLLQFGLSQNIFQLRTSLQASINTKKKEAQATQKATTSQDNSGTGTPGTAGQGAGADDLQEVSTTGRRVPEEVNVTGTRRDPDGLDGVTVTGKRNPDELEEVQVTGIRNPDELEEVQVTGSRNTNNAVPGATKRAQAQSTLQDTTNFKKKEDWRVRLSLSPGATYLYKDPANKLLEPLGDTDGVIFPYTPRINVVYAANYGTTNPAHTNYTIYQYQNSTVDNITVTCEFTAQDTFEARYLLAVIHFFRSLTKMFYGQDQNPKPGTPPPLVYLFGLGEFQFNAHPLALTSFNYDLPNDVDYIRAGELEQSPGVNRSEVADAAGPPKTKSNSFGQIVTDIISSRLSSGAARIFNAVGLKLTPGGSLAEAGFGIGSNFNPYVAPGTIEPTYVPTKINIQLTFIPIISRYEISQNFSLKDYANGKLLNGVKRAGGGFW